MKKLSFVLLFFVLNNLLLSAQSEKPKNIILVIANGFGYGHLSYIVNDLHKESTFKDFNSNGIIYNNTDCQKHIAPSVAIATGQIPEPKCTGIDQQGNKLKTLTDIARENKKAIGIISAASITDPANAVFFAHQKNLEKNELIAIDLFNIQPDLVIAGGQKYFKNRTDNRDLLVEFKKNEYKIITEAKDITKGSQLKTLALIENEHLPKAKQREDFYIKSFQRAFKTLIKHDNGYFLIITMPHIAWTAIENNSENMKAEIDDFLNLIAKIKLFTIDDPQTLVIVASDTDAGALSLVPDDKNPLKWNSRQFTPMTFPVFAYGNAAEIFSGLFPSNLLYEKISNLIVK